jgi:hypothetical protein
MRQSSFCRVVDFSVAFGNEISAFHEVFEDEMDGLSSLVLHFEVAHKSDNILE